MADCVRNTIDSNVVGLSFAETICGVLPTIEVDGYLPTWYELEPNTYASFGGEISTVARNPINASRQRKKGTVIDFDATAGFNQDFTLNNYDRLLQGFFFANWREKPNTNPINGNGVSLTAVTAASDAFEAASGLGDFISGHLIKASGFSVAANNGVKTVATVADDAVAVTSALTDEAPGAAAMIEAVGYQFGAGAMALTVDMAGGFGTVSLSAAPTAATGTLTVAAGNAAPGDTITVGSTTYTFVAGAPSVEFDIPIGADEVETAANFAMAVNGSIMLTDANTEVTATDNADGTVTLTAIVPGITGNGIATVANGGDLSFAAATLTGATNLSFIGLGLIVGEWVYLGGDDEGTYFPDNVGYARIGSISDTEITFDKTTFDVSAVAAGALTIQMYFGNVLRNEKDPDLIVTHMYEFMRTLGNDANGRQSEYVTAAVANELTLNVPLTDKVTADVGFIARDKINRTGAQGVKAGEKLAALGQDAFNTSSDAFRVRMALVDDTTSSPTGFFGYLSEYELVINNNVSGVKGIGRLGNIDVSVGTFEVGGELTAYFSDLSAPQSIRDNASVTVDAIFAKLNTGFIWDIPLLTVGGGEVTVTPDEPITIPVEQMGAENPHGYTLMYVNFPYLPNAAMPTQD